MIEDILRLYLDPGTVNHETGYPYAWYPQLVIARDPAGENVSQPRIPDLVRELTGHRCVRCRHPFEVGVTPGEWSPCDEECTHGGPIRAVTMGDVFDHMEAQWRILTVHHLNGIKHDCRWWNLASLCQRCHLTIQGKVYMERPWTKQHSQWFKPYVAGYYAWRFLGLELGREEVEGRLEELLTLEDRQLSIEGE